MNECGASSGPTEPSQLTHDQPPLQRLREREKRTAALEEELRGEHRRVAEREQAARELSEKIRSKDCVELTLVNTSFHTQVSRLEDQLKEASGLSRESESQASGRGSV